MKKMANTGKSGGFGKQEPNASFRTSAKNMLGDSAQNFRSDSGLAEMSLPELLEALRQEQQLAGDTSLPGESDQQSKP